MSDEVTGPGGGHNALSAPGEGVEQRRFVFGDGELSLEQATPDARRRLLVADSWLVDNNRVRAVDLHHDRFVGSCIASGYTDTAALAAFWESALGAIPPQHRWFPRVELWAVPGGAGRRTPAGAAARTGADSGRGTATDAAGRLELSLLMRLAPPPASAAVLGTHLGEDPRSIPSVKGPDLERLTSLRNAARADGVDDLVLLAADGAIVEGTTTALVWWRGDELRVPPAELARVDSVTARTIAVLARAFGVPVADERATLGDLGGTELWAVNALYGIRLVTAWHGGPAVDAGAGAVARATAWQRRLAQLARPLP